MSDNTLVQRRFLTTVSYTIAENGVQIDERGFREQTSYFQAFEDIPSQPFRLHHFQRTGIMLSVFCIFLAVVLLVGLINTGELDLLSALFAIAFGGVPTLLTWLTRRDVAGFGKEGDMFVLHGSLPSRQEVNAFLERLHQAKIAYLRRTYFETSDSDGVEHQHVLLWLHNLGAISDAELQAHGVALPKQEE